MKKIILCIMLLAVLVSAGAETAFDGTLYTAYTVDYDEKSLPGWDIMTYTEISGLLLSAYCDTAEISVSLDESEASPESALSARLKNLSNYGTLLSGGEIAYAALNGLESAACAEYSYRLNRDGGMGDIYRVKAYAVKLGAERMLIAVCTSWGEEGALEVFDGGFMSSLSLTQKNVSAGYTAILTGCEARGDEIYLTIDYCDVMFSSDWGAPYARNADPSKYDYRLAADAEILLPYPDSGLYRQYKAEYDVNAIEAAIDDYFKLNLTDGIYTVVFNEAGDIARLVHYNAF